MTIFNAEAYQDHQQIHFWHDTQSGLKAIIALHRYHGEQSPSLGGCRMWPYGNDDDALDDVLQLSRAMSYKNALAGLPYGGGKCVIIGDAKRDKSPELLRSMGRFIESLNGQMVTGEDVGISVDDVDVMRRETTFLVGREGQDSSPAAAFGVYIGIKSAVQYQLNRQDLNGITVAIQGVGQVGYALAEYLYKEGAELILADIDDARVQEAAKTFSAKVVPVAEIHQVPCDVFAPCALGGIINESSINQLNCRIIAGAANNQLSSVDLARELKSKGILYSPDYVINAGGVINNAMQMAPNYCREVVFLRCKKIGKTLQEVYHYADQHNLSTLAAADTLAEQRMNQVV